jgi:hypothetical protein
MNGAAEAIFKGYRLLCFFSLLAVAAVCAAQAHFSEGTQVRTILVAEENGALTVYVRVPAPLLFSDLILQSQVDDVPLVSPFLRLERSAEGERYRLDGAAISDDRTAFVARLRDALVFSQAGLDLTATVTAFTVHDRMPEQGFDSVQLAQGALVAPQIPSEPYFGEAVVDYSVRLTSTEPAGVLSVRSGYPPLLPGPGLAIDNHLIDARTTPPVSTTAPGQLEEPAVMDGSSLSTFVHFVRQGVLHILEGLDHVLLVVSLALGVGATRKLIYLVTAFTLGHSVTLIATFLGATPSWPWFIPVVETAIAASVLYAAVSAMMRKSGSILVFAVIGLLHGLGFSFVLGGILGRNAPDLIPALLAFNIGVELGQLAILAVTLSAVLVISRFARPALQPARFGALTGITILSAWWMLERLPGVIQSI